MKNVSAILINSVLNTSLDYNRTNILVLTSNYISRNRKIISDDVTEYTVYKEVDSVVSQFKETGSISDFISQFIEDVKPYKMFRVQIISKETEDSTSLLYDNSWHTLLNILNSE